MWTWAVEELVVRVCLISNQIAAWGKIGGFGTATRALGHGLVKRGIDVHAVVPRRSAGGQGRVEYLDGIVVHGTSPMETLFSGRIFREINADIHHSQEPTIASRLAQKALPGRIHVVTCRDPRAWEDHFIELQHASLKRRLMAPVTWYYEASPWVKDAVRTADAVLSPAPAVLDRRIRKLYGEDIASEFVPYPIDLSGELPRKAVRPTVLFVGRFDRRKRIETFFRLASRFPDVEFIAVGRAHEVAYDRQLRKKYGDLPNVWLPGFVSRFDRPGLAEFYERAWILVNTSPREGLPYTFLEALGYGVALLSCLDPDSFSSRFGYFVEDGDFEGGLKYLLRDDRWRILGESGMNFVRSTWDDRSCIDRHLEIYARLLGDATGFCDAHATTP